MRGLRDHVVAGDRRGAGGRLRERREDADRRRLAGAVVAEQSENGALGDDEVDVPESPFLAELLAEPSCLNSGCGG